MMIVGNHESRLEKFMALDKAIESGKERREIYRKSKAFDVTCRNHGSCSYCRRNRTHSNVKARKVADEKFQEYLTHGA